MENYGFFICHSSKDSKLALSIVNIIESTGHKCWIAPRDIPYGTPYARAIMNGIYECETFIVLITDNSIKSEDVLNEVDNAHAFKKKIVPVRFTENQLSRELNYYLSRTQWLSLKVALIDKLPALLNLEPNDEVDLKDYKVSNAMQNNHKQDLLSKSKHDTILKCIQKPFNWGRTIGLVVLIVSFVWLIYSLSNRHPDDILLYSSMLISTIFFIITVIGIVKPTCLGIKTRIQCLFYWGMSAILMAISIGSFVAIRVVPDNHANSILQTSAIDDSLRTNDTIIPTFASDTYGINTRQLFELKELGDSAFENGKYDEAIKWFKKMSEYGNGYGQYMIGKCYYSGLGISRDFHKAFEYFSAASLQMIPDAINSKGICYLTGRGVKKNFVKAAECFKEAAEKGLPVAQANLADCYVYGNGVEQNYITAKKYYEDAANQNYAPAAYNIGRLYYNGRPGIGLNYSKATSWYRFAANLGLPQAQNSLGVCYLKGQGVNRDPNEAFQWFEKSANQGFATAYYNLANCYRDGSGVNKDIEKAKQLYSIAADKGSISAKKALLNI